jgi:hypothetical protein
MLRGKFIFPFPEISNETGKHEYSADFWPGNPTVANKLLFFKKNLHSNFSKFFSRRGLKEAIFSI